MSVPDDLERLGYAVEAALADAGACEHCGAPPRFDPERFGVAVTTHADDCARFTGQASTELELPELVAPGLTDDQLDELLAEYQITPTELMRRLGVELPDAPEEDAS